MIKKSKSIYIISYMFFFLYFISYFNFRFNMLIKYGALVVYQLFFIFLIKKKNMKFNKSIIIIMFLIIASLLISLMVNYDLDALIKTFSLIDLMIFSCFIFPTGIEKYALEEIDFFKIITNCLFIVLVIGLTFFYGDLQLSIGRSTGLSVRHLFNCGHASVVGFLCFIEFCLTFYTLTGLKNQKLQSIFAFAKLITSVYMAYLADIRAALVSMIVFILLYLFYKLPKNSIVLFFKIIVALLLFVFSFIYINNTAFDLEQLNFVLSGRLSYYQESIIELKENNSVLFGNGSFRNSSVENLNKIQVDNSYVDLLYQYGFFTLFFFICLIVYLVIKIIKSKKVYNNKFEYKYTIFIKSYFFSVLAYSLVEKNLFSISCAVSLVTYLLIFWYIRKTDLIESNAKG